MFQDRILHCKECGNEFPFTADEQKFYAERGFQNEPQRCNPCRNSRKVAVKRARKYFIASCTDCNEDAKIPFEPKPGRPAYCVDCYFKWRLKSRAK